MLRTGVDESSRDHHYSASINTMLRKMLAGLDMPAGMSAWTVVKCRPEAIFWPDLLPSAAANLNSRRGEVGCSWKANALHPPPPPAALDLPTALCAISPIFTGAVSGPAPLVLRCPAGESIESITFARWGKSSDPTGPEGWYCFGPQPPPKAACEQDVAARLAPLCVGKNSCDLSANASTAVLGNPCVPPPPKVCPPGQHVDFVEAAGDNGSCDCESYCASDWAHNVKKQRPKWTGATSLTNATKACQCVQATHWCPAKGVGCSSVCDGVGKPTARDFCVPGDAPLAPQDPNMQLIVRVACNKAQRAGRNSLPLAATAQPAAPAAKHSTLAGQVWATVNVSVPGGSVGEVHVPILSAESGLIKESGAAVWKDGAFAEPMPVGIKAVRSDGRFVVFETGAGRSSFTSAT